MKLLCVVVNYRTAELAVKAVRSILADLGDLSAEIEVVDNDSQDGSYEHLVAAVAEEGWGEQVRVTASGRNGGFGFGNNLAIARGLQAPDPPDYVLLLNPDAEVHAGTLAALVEFMEAHPRAGIAGARLLYPDGTTSTSTFRFPNLLGELESSLRLRLASRVLEPWAVPQPLPARTREVDWVSGTCMLVRREAFEQAGLFDEEFFLYSEETDLCRRVRAVGFEIHYVNETAVSHIQGASTGLEAGFGRRRPAYWYESRRLYFVKNHGVPYYLAANLLSVVGTCVDQLRGAVLRDRPQRWGELSDMLKHTVSSLLPQREA